MPEEISVRRSTLVGTAACAVVFGSFAMPSSAWACSICQAGDPLFSAGGPTAQEQGTLSAYLEIQGWRKTSGLLPHHEGEEAEPGREVNEGQQLSLLVGYTPISRLTVTLLAPVRFNEIREEPDEEEHETSSLSGFGDLSLTLGYVLWRDREVLPATWLEARAFGKFPTGKSKQSVDGVKDPHLQLGTGSWDFGFGLAGAHRMSWGSLYTSASYRVNTEGSLDYEYGDVVLANVALETPLSELVSDPLFHALVPGVELNYRYAAKDHYQGSSYSDSGGSILYATPSLRIRLPWFAGQRPPSLRLAVQLPFTQTWLNGQQDEGPVWSVGLGMAF
jgi:hypothetical protein